MPIPASSPTPSSELSEGETLSLVMRERSGQDAYGNDAFTTTTASFDGWAVYPRNSSELLQGQDVGISGVTAVYPGALITASVIDAVTIETGAYAGSYEVDGLPGYYTHPVAGTQVTELHLTRITG